VLRYPYLWPHSQVLGAAMGLAGMSLGGSDHESELVPLRRGMEWYWDASAAPPAYASYLPPPLGQGGDVYYDDNGWAGLMLIQHFRMTDDATSLERSRASSTSWPPAGMRIRRCPHPAACSGAPGWNRDRNTVPQHPPG
jgi:hypothetical protein